MNILKKIFLGFSAFITGTMALAIADIILDGGLSFLSLGMLALFTFLTVFQIKKIITSDKVENEIRDARYEDAYRKGREMVNRAYDEKVNKLTDAELKAELEKSLDEVDIEPEELSEMLKDKTQQEVTQKADY